MSWTEFKPTLMIPALVDAGVDFVIVGGVAVIAHASPRFTKDLDICYSLDPANLEALGSTLVAHRAQLRGVDENVPFIADARTLRQTQILCLDTDAGGIDLLVDPAGAPPYDQLRAQAEIMEIADRSVRVAALEDLIAIKQAAGRPQDLADLESLRIAQRRLGQRRTR